MHFSADILDGYIGRVCADFITLGSFSGLPDLP